MGFQTWLKVPSPSCVNRMQKVYGKNNGIIQITNKCGKAGMAGSSLAAERLACRAAARTK
jgi:hypothetical protein